MNTRARNVCIDTLSSKLDRVLYSEVYFAIKWDTLCPGDGTYPAQQEKEELARVKQLKTRCYREAERKFKALGVFSSAVKKESLCRDLLQTIRQIEQHNTELQEFIGPSRMPRGVVEASVLRALFNGLRKMKLSDARMPGFDDWDEEGI